VNEDLLSTLDVLVDWTGRSDLTEHGSWSPIDELRPCLEWARLGARVKVAMPEGVPEAARLPPGPPPGMAVSIESDPVAILRKRMTAASLEARDLLICFTTALPDVEVLRRLRDALAVDPMFGAAAPRIALQPSGGLLALEPERRDPEGMVVPPSRILELDDYYVLPELVLPCMLVKSRLLSNLDPPLAGERDLPEALWDVLRRARRCGFRVVVDNRIRIPVENARAGLTPEIRPLSLAEDDGDRALSESALGRIPGLRLEGLLSAASRRGEGAAPILLDCTGLSLTFNGTSAAILGLLDGFHRLGPAAGEVGILALAPARSYFRLEERYPRLPGVDPKDASSWGVALRLSQAWRLSTWVDLHRRALAVLAVILDTIAIDILYSAPEGAEEAFAFGAEHADGLTYVSEFSRDQFHRRFRVDPAVREMVHYLSFDAEDHVTRGATRTKSEPFALIVGNDYDHKDVDRTAMALADAFPFRSFKAIGLSDDFAHARPNVEAVPSGSLPAEALQDLYSRASSIVYPSFYEGFGLPIVMGLSLGKTVVARRSPLLCEIADRVLPHGKLLGFEHYAELVEILGSVLHGVAVEGLPLGGGLGPEGRPMSCTAIAERLAKFARECAARGGGEKWRRRDAALRYVRAPR